MNNHEHPAGAGRRVASVDVREGARATLLPMGAEQVRITGGFWAERQRTNRSVSLPEAAERLEEAGNFENLRLAAGQSSGAYRTPTGEPLPFLDSDVYKWLEAIGWELGREPSPELEKLADDAIALVAAAQDDDGYLNSYYQVVEPDRRWVDLAHGHELYCAGHLIQAAVSHARGRGDQALLEVARGVADCIDREFGTGQREGVPGHPEIEMALVELYRLTGEERYLRLAAYFVDERGRGLAGFSRYGSSYFQDHQPVREATTVTGHAVRALYLAAGATDLYLETGEEALLGALVRQWESMVSTKMYLTGGVGSRHRDEAFGDPYELPPDRAYNETCAAIASVMWAWRLLLATGEARYADLIERTLYNGFAPGFSLDGHRYFYVNRLQARVDPDMPTPESPPRDSLGRQPWFGCACCPPNVMRMLSSIEHYVATRTDRGVQLHQYVPATVSVAAPDGGLVQLEIDTDYPWSGRVDVHVTETAASDWELTFRVPSWCTDATFAVNGAAPEPAGGGNGHATISRSWSPGDHVTFEMGMPVRLTEPHPHVDAVRGCLAIERGPLVYCLEHVDLPADVELADVSIAADSMFEAVPEPELLAGVVTAHTTATARPPAGWSGAPYRPVRANGEAPATDVRIRAVPYFAWANREPGPMRVWIPRT